MTVLMMDRAAYKALVVEKEQLSADLGEARERYKEANEAAKGAMANLVFQTNHAAQQMTNSNKTVHRIYIMNIAYTVILTATVIFLRVFDLL